MTIATEAPARLSWSQVSAYQQCPAKWWFSRRLPAERTPSALHFGKAVHRALDAYYGSRMEGYCPGLDELLSAFQASWDEEPSAPLAFGKGEDAESLAAMAGRMLASFLESSRPGEIVAVEQPFAVEIAEGVLVTGAVDLVEVKDGRMWIVDSKTSRSAPPAGLGRDQLGLYLIGLRELGLVPFGGGEGLRCDVLRKLKAKAAFESVEVELSERDLDALRQKVAAIARAASERIVWRAPSWACAGCQWSRACARADLEAELSA